MMETKNVIRPTHPLARTLDLVFEATPTGRASGDTAWNDWGSQT